MSENNDGKTPVKIEDMIGESLSGDARELALEFVEFLKEIDMPPAGNAPFFSANYKNAEGVCHIFVSGDQNIPGPWTIWTDGEYYAPEYALVDDALKSAAAKYINYCTNCGCGSPGKPATILGVEYKNICHSALGFYQPDAEAVDCAKKLLLLRKTAIDGAEKA